jgi:hypothetical protein
MSELVAYWGAPSSVTDTPLEDMGHDEQLEDKDIERFDKPDGNMVEVFVFFNNRDDAKEAVRDGIVVVEIDDDIAREDIERADVMDRSNDELQA